MCLSQTKILTILWFRRWKVVSTTGAQKQRCRGEYLGEFASDQISRGGTLLLYDVEERKYEELTKEKFLAGMKRYLEHPIYKDTIYPGTHEGRYLLDCTLIDAPVSDMIIQYALFGEIVYD